VRIYYKYYFFSSLQKKGVLCALLSNYVGVLVTCSPFPKLKLVESEVLRDRG
jgi:hypothetical protein